MVVKLVLEKNNLVIEYLYFDVIRIEKDGNWFKLTHKNKEEHTIAGFGWKTTIYEE